MAVAVVNGRALRKIDALSQRAHAIVRDNLAEVRRSVLELRAPLLGPDTLPSALIKLVKASAADIGATGSFKLEGTYRGLPAQVETQLYRIAQEALHNAERVRLVGGSLYVASEPGEGTMVEATVPLESRDGER